VISSIAPTGLLSLDTFVPDEWAPRLRNVITALCFVDVTPEFINEAGQAIAEIDGVRAAYSVTGDIDLIALIEVSDHEEVARVVTDGISKVPGVQTTQTHISFRTYSKRDLEAGFSIGS
jgi:DNA-binding Lrp family transcriptional regulator